MNGDSQFKLLSYGPALNYPSCLFNCINNTPPSIVLSPLSDTIPGPLYSLQQAQLKSQHRLKRLRPLAHDLLSTPLFTVYSPIQIRQS